MEVWRTLIKLNWAKLFHVLPERKFAEIYETKNNRAQIERMKEKPSEAFSIYRSMQNLSARVSIAKKAQ